VAAVDVPFDGRGIAAPVARARSGNSQHEQLCLVSLFAGMPVKTGIQKTWIPGRASYRQLARNDDSTDDTR